MAVSTGYDYGIRKGLNEKGIDNSQIGYNPSNQSVTVGGQNFMKADKAYNGTAYTNQGNFNTAWDNYYKALQQPQTPQPTPTPTPTPSQGQPYQYNAYANGQANNNPYTGQYDQMIQSLLNYNQNQPQFDPYSSSSYKAAEAQAGRAAQQSTRAAQESYGSAGFGRSYGLGERVAGINNDSNEYLMTQVLPQIEAQEQARRQQEFNNMIAAMQPLMNQQNRADNLVQQDFNNRITESGLTGNYMNPEAEAVINQLLQLKGDSEANWTIMAPEQREASRSQGDAYRNQLLAMGMDPALFGSDVTSANARTNQGMAGRTIQGQELDQRIKESNFDARNKYAELTGNIPGLQEDWSGFDRQEAAGGLPKTSAQQQTQFNQNDTNRKFEEDKRRYDQDFQYTQGRDVVKDQQWMDEFNHRVTQDGMQNALAWANNSISRYNSETSRMDSERLRDQANAPAAGPSAAEMRTYFDSMAQRNDKGQLTNPIDMERSILNSELSEYDTYQMYLRYGLKWGGEIPKKPNSGTGTGSAAGAGVGIKVPQQYQGIVQSAAQRHNVPENLVAAIIQAESSFNSNARSGAGAQGLMQLMPGTARGLGVIDPYNPSQNVNGGTQYISQMLSKYGNVEMALAAYNWGPGSLDKAIKKHGNSWSSISRHAPKETQNYVAKVTKNLG